ncbi:MAG: hypothetical protein ACRD3E_03635, partial [Terriglobales bacterium]
MVKIMVRKFTILQWQLTVLYFLIPALAFIFGIYLRFWSGLFPPSFVDYPSYTWLTILATITWGATVEHYKLNRLDTRNLKVVGTTKATLATVTMVVGSGFFYRSASFSRFVIAFVAFSLFAGAILLRDLYVNRGRSRLASRQSGLIVIGSDDVSRRRALKVAQNGLVDTSILAYVDLPGQHVKNSESPNVFPWGELHGLLEREKPDEVLIATGPEQFDNMADVLPELQNLCIPVRLALDMGDVFYADHLKT